MTLVGAGLGGNKLPGLEFLIADALARDCDSLVTGQDRSRTQVFLVSGGAPTLFAGPMLRPALS